MAGNHKKRLGRVFERVAIGLVILDAVVYFAILQPIRSRTQAKFESINEERLRLKNQETRVRRLEWYKGALPATEKDLTDFMGNEVQSKRKSYSRSTRLVRDLAKDAGLDLDPGAIVYRMEPLRDAPLDRMNLGLTVKGPFQNLLNFAHAIETTSDDFIVLRDFSFDSSSTEGLTMHLSADLYLTR